MIAGASMRPTLNPGDVVYLQSISPRIGDVIGFSTSSGETVIHRLILKLPFKKWIHCGDSPDVFEAGVINPSRVVGVAPQMRKLPSLNQFKLATKHVARKLLRAINNE